MRLRGSVALPVIILTVASTTDFCADGFRIAAAAGLGGLGGGITSGTRRTATRRLGNIGVLKFGVGLLGLGGATMYLCSTLSDQPPPPINEPGVNAPVTVLTHVTDYYDGVTIDETSLPQTVDEFKTIMESSLEEWRSAGRKGVWLKVPAERAELVKVSLEMGFTLHHAEKTYIMLNKWLPTAVNQLPSNASHQVGVGAYVLNEKGEVLVVREKNGPLRGTGVWKFPTGLIDTGEDIPDAAAREVMEETGVDVEFESILAFRHSHGGLFGKGDLFFVVRMRLKPGTDGSKLSPQASEIEDCKWMPRDEFVEQSVVQGTPLQKELSRIVEADVASASETAASRAGEDGSEAETKMKVATFVGKKLESSRQEGAMSMLYYGKL